MGRSCTIQWVEVEFFGTGFRSSCLQGLFHFLIGSKTNTDFFLFDILLPTPLYFIDENNAALDFRNVSIVANYIKDGIKNAQFIIIFLSFLGLYLMPHRTPNH